MIHTRYPIKLNKEPLVDAICEVRFTSPFSVTEILPGILFSKIGEPKNIIDLPAAQVPRQIRKNEPSFKFAPLYRIDLGKFFINVGDNLISIGCMLPYSGWPVFKTQIIDIMRHLSKTGTIQTVERCSMKYVNIIPAKPDKNHIDALNFSASIADRSISNEPLQVRIDFMEDDLLNIIQIACPAFATLLDQTTLNGTVVDVDTIQNFEPIEFETFLVELEKRIERIRQVNKVMFFNCLRPETIEAMEPIYEHNKL